MGRMLGALLLLALAQEAPAFEPEPYANAPFEVKFGKPQGFEAVADEVGLLLHRAGVGFRVTREPMLEDPETFASSWSGKLGGAGKEGKVTASKVGKYQAWSTGYDVDAGGPRRIEIWRIYAPDPELLYNFRFSAPPAYPLKALVDGVLKAFACSAPRPKLEVPDRASPVEGRWYIRLPKGYESVKDAAVRLGGGSRSGFVKLLPGYDPPHPSAWLQIAAHNPAGSVYMEDGRIVPGSKYEEFAAKLLADVQTAELVTKLDGKPKGKARSFSPFKDGYELTVAGTGADGSAKEICCYVGKVDSDLAFRVTLVADARELRLHKDLLKQLCSNLFRKE